jgi:predicted TIM-barrel fold metal-dependent hydrolase
MDDKVENLIKNYKGNSIPKIDIHVHYLPQAYIDALLNRGEKNPDGFPIPKWDPEMHLKAMDQLGISKSMLSISSPHISFGDRNAAKVLARKVNEDGAELVKKYPGRFGLFASLPLPNVEDSIEEIQYAKDILQVDGFALPTNAQGIYLGNPSLDPVFEELNRLKAVVILHPNKPGKVPENVVEGLPIPMMEFFFDTTRTVMNMILKETLKKFPDIKFVIPHAGAFLPILADRIAPAIKMTPDSFGENIKGEADRIDIYGALKNLYYDVAGVCLPRQLADVLQIVSVGHLLYGSDYPYTPKSGCIILADALDKTKLLDNEQRHAVYYDNAMKLFSY